MAGLVSDYLLDGLSPDCWAEGECVHDFISRSWADAEGASLIRTLGKAWGEEAPLALFALFRPLILRSALVGAQDSAAAETGALAVAYLLPALLKCASTGQPMMWANIEPQLLHPTKEQHSFECIV